LDIAPLVRGMPLIPLGIPPFLIKNIVVLPHREGEIGNKLLTVRISVVSFLTVRKHW
jgi:hypothetical protein